MKDRERSTQDDMCEEIIVPTLSQKMGKDGAPTATLDAKDENRPCG